MYVKNLFYICGILILKLKKLIMKNFYNYLQVNKYSSKSVFPYILEFYTQENRVVQLRFELFGSISEAKDFYNRYDLSYKLKKQNK